MLTMLIFLALQAAPAAKAEPERWSILVPVANEPCRPSRRDNSSAENAAQGRTNQDGDVVVCGDALPSQRLPLPGEAVSDGAQPSNRELTGRGALAAAGTPCAARQGGCQTSFGPPIVPMVAGAIGLVKDALRKHPDKSNRVAIPLDDLPPEGNAAPAASPAK
ncbi:MAG: hypothetical protein P0Y59_12735 [Candidatus Sphingomonas phytovorans]|nr:hypothetical protein [Sphingomonas sp.]WEJ97833.1 MAG: hypothetical protein P0Y59_12735 [Sphingomonas sp.]